MLVDFQTISSEQRYFLMSQTVVPRPIAWIATNHENGTVNLAPFSYFAPLSSEPPVVVVSVGHRPDGSAKDTLHNIRVHKTATINIGSKPFLDALHATSTSLPSDESEVETYGIPTEIIDPDFPPAVKQIPCALLCTYRQSIELEGSKTIPLILEINKIHLHPDHVDEQGRAHIEGIGRVGRSYWTDGRMTHPSV